MVDLTLQHFVTPAARGMTRLYYRCPGESLRLSDRGLACATVANDLSSAPARRESSLRESSEKTISRPSRGGSRSATPQHSRHRSLILQGGSSIRTETFFNGFFEDYWRANTLLERLELRVSASGSGIVRLLRRLPSGTRELLAKARFAGAKQEICLAAPRAQNSTGLLYFELQSHSDRTALHSADWVARDVTPREVKLAIGYCSFDREDELLHNVQTLVKERKLDDLLSQIVVVDQGTRKVHDHRRYKETVERANGRLSVIEQLNLGGAGGFTRCILEVCKDPSVTHILLTDDDAIIDSESVLRTARFLALCKADVAVAGHLLDRQNPAELVEVGGSYDTTVAAMSPARHRRANRASELRELASARENQTGGWWYFAFPLKKVQQVGLPLPLFLRGDDAEYGCRLSQSGVRIIPLPGIAVRHEAIDRTRRGWQEYYDVRNMLILGAIHFEVSQRTIIRRFTGELLGALFTFQYERAALHCLAIADYLRGPGLVCRPADAIHEAVLGARRRLMPTSQAADDSTGSRASTSQCLQGGFLRAMRLLVRNLLLPSPLPNARPSYVIDKTACKWRSLGTEDVFAVAEETSNSWIVYRRSRARFVELLVSGTWLAVRLLLRHRTTRRSWRDGARALTTHSFWLRFTGMESKAITPR